IRRGRALRASRARPDVRVLHRPVVRARSSHGLLHFLHRLRAARPRRLFAASEHVRDLRVRASLDLAQDERGALSRRKRAYRGREVRQRHTVAFRRGKAQVRERYEAARASHPIHRLVRRDLVEPCPLVTGAWRCPRAERGEKRLLVEIVGVRSASCQAQHVGEDLALVALQKLTERHRSDPTTIERARRPDVRWAHRARAARLNKSEKLENEREKEQCSWVFPACLPEYRTARNTTAWGGSLCVWRSLFELFAFAP